MPTPVSTGSLTIADLNDGIYALLSSETGLVHCDSAGTPTTTLTTTPLTTMMTVYKGNSVQTGFSFSRTASSGITSSVNASGVLSVTGITVGVDSGWVDITASKSGEPSITKRYVISKVKQGIQGIQGPQGIQGVTGQTGAQGPQGTPAIMGLLTNDSHVVPTDSAGNNGNFNGCNTTVKILVGTSDDSANWNVTAIPTNVTGNLSGKTYTVESLSADVGYVDFSATRSGYPTIPLRFTVTRSKQGSAGANGSPGATGASATAYWLVSSVAAIKKSITGAYTPTTITFSAKSQTGTSSPVNYAGRFRIHESANGSTWTLKYTSSANEASKAYTPSAGIVAINCELYLAGGVTTLIDQEIVPIVSDGATGSQGPSGTSITSVDVEYAISTSNTTAPTTGWSTDSPAWEDGKYLWARTKTTYSVGDPTYTNPACITGGKGATGADGRGIASITYTYATSQTPTGAKSAYSSSMFTLSATNKYGWQKEVISYTDGSTPKTTEAIIAVYGDKGADGSNGADGRGIASIAYTYATSQTQTGIKSAYSSSMFTLSATNKFGWQKEVITFTDGSTPKTTEAIIAVYGDTGASDQLIVQYALGTWDAPPSTVIIGEESWGLGKDYWIAGQNFWQSTVKYTTSPDEYVWRRERIYHPSTDTYSDWSYTRLSGVQGEPGRPLELTADTGVILFTARGILITEEIKLTIASANIPIENVTISRSDAGALTKVDDYHYTLDCSTVMTDTITVEATATYLNKSYSSTVSVTKYVDPNSTPHNFGGVTVVPNLLPDGGWLATGDYFLWADSNIPAGSTAAPVVAYPNLVKGEIYEYNGTAWMQSANGDLVMTLFDSFADLANDVDSSVMGLAVIKKLVAIDAFITNLFTQEIEILDDGFIKSSNFKWETLEKTGFKLSADGTFQVVAASLVKAFIDSSDGSGTLLKTQYGGNGESREYSAPTRWRASDLTSQLSYGATGTLTYDGTSYSYLRTSAGTSYWLTIIRVSSGNRYWTCSYEGLYTIRNYGTAGGQAITYITHNGVQTSHAFAADGYVTKDVYLYVGDIVQARSDGPANLSDSALYMKYEGVIIYNPVANTGPSYILRIPSNPLAAIEKRLVIGSWDSDDHKIMGPMTSWNLFTLALNTPQSTNSTVTIDYDSADYHVYSVTKYSTYLLLQTLENVTFSLLSTISTSEIAESGWYPISGTITFVTEERGIVLADLIPESNTTNIGTPSIPFNIGNFNQLNLGGSEMFACRAWVNFNGQSPNPPRGSANVSSITRFGAGSYRVNFITEMPDNGYATVVSGIGARNATNDYYTFMANGAWEGGMSQGTTFTDISITNLMSGKEPQAVNVAVFR